MGYFRVFGIFLVLLGIWDFFGTFGYFGYLGKKISLSKYILSAPFDQVSPDILSVQQLSFLFFMFLLCNFLLFHIFPFFLFYFSPWCRISSLSFLLLIVLPQKCCNSQISFQSFNKIKIHSL